MAEKLSTADCQKYLVDKYAKDIREMYMEDGVDELSDYSKKIIANAANPKKWKRMTKYTVGSDIDKGEKECAPGGYGGMNYCDYGKYAGGIVRTFYLDETDHITYNLIEVDGQIVGEDDCSD